MTWNLILTKPAEKQLRKIHNPDHARLITALKAIQASPLRGEVRKLEDMGPAYRRRVGKWRILFDLDQQDRLVVVHAITRRTTTTYRKR